MTFAIVIIMLLGYALICMEHITRVNKATVAVFCGVVGWVLFICVGPDYILKLHPENFKQFLDGAPFTIAAVNTYIAEHLFARHIFHLCSIVMYLLATMAIVELLQNNGCFDFITDWCRSRSRWRVVCSLAFFSFILSANLDNLTSSVLMLLILNQLIINPVQRRLLGVIVVIATSCGGCFTVIGDVTSLVIWTKEVVTPTDYSFALFLPAVVATVVPTALIGRKLPERLDIKRPGIMFRGDSSILPVWQRLIMLVVGIGGLWFVPTFYRLTHLPPFLGALCVLGVLWVVNEIVNRRSILTDQPITIGASRSLQYAILQMIMFFVGVGLCVDVLIEVGAMQAVASWCDEHIHNIYIMSIFLGMVSAVMDNIALVLSAVSIYHEIPDTSVMTEYMTSFIQNGQYWHLIALSSCVGGCLLPIGSTAGYTLMKSEDVTIWWYFRHITIKVLVGWILALGFYFVVDSFLR